MTDRISLVHSTCQVMCWWRMRRGHPCLPCPCPCLCNRIRRWREPLQNRRSHHSLRKNHDLHSTVTPTASVDRRAAAGMSPQSLRKNHDLHSTVTPPASIDRRAAAGISPQSLRQEVVRFALNRYHKLKHEFGNWRSKIACCISKTQVSRQK